MEPKELIARAIAAMDRAYVPYSGYRVGAALLCADGKVYEGCNIENGSYGATNCAERTAFFRAVFDGEREFTAIAVCGGKDGIIRDYFPPCGICRQVMREFCDPEEFRIILGAGTGEKQVYLLKELLPLSFGPDNLNGKEKHS